MQAAAIDRTAVRDTAWMCMQWVFISSRPTRSHRQRRYLRGAVDRKSSCARSLREREGYRLQVTGYRLQVTGYRLTRAIRGPLRTVKSNATRFADFRRQGASIIPAWGASQGASPSTHHQSVIPQAPKARARSQFPRPGALLTGAMRRAIGPLAYKVCRLSQACGLGWYE